MNVAVNDPGVPLQVWMGHVWISSCLLSGCLGFQPRATLAFILATGFIADSASLPLVISNLVNIVSADYFNLDFGAYAAIMVPVDLAAILASLAFHTRVTAADVHREGITEVSARDIAAAREMDCTVKLLAICERVEGPDGQPGISARVHPALIPLTHPLASVREAYNAVFVEAGSAGELMFYGQGAGGDPTASAVLGDVVAVARHRVAGGKGPGESAYADLPVLPMGRARTRYHVSLDVADRSGVLAQVAQVFAAHEVSIETVRQQVVTEDEDGTPTPPRAALVIVTHSAEDAALTCARMVLSRSRLACSMRAARATSTASSRAARTASP